MDAAATGLGLLVFELFHAEQEALPRNIKQFPYPKN